MEGVHVGNSMSLLLCFMVAGCTVSQNGSQLGRANELVASYGRHLGASGEQLDNNDRAFGSCGFHYDTTRNVLVGRAFVARAMTKTADEKGRENYRRVEKALNDPKVGGMFERAGALFVLEEEKEAYFLMKEFPVATTTEAALSADMDEMQNVAAMWTMRWFFRVSMIAHGHELPPTAPVTRANDPR